MKRLCIIVDVLMVLAIFGFVAYLLQRTPDAKYDVDRSQYPVKGIDISAHNGDVNFDRVAADSVSFVVLKATEGIDFCDAKFSANYTKARQAGLKVGAYHFFRFDSPGDIQAQHFLASVNGRAFDMPMMIDVEKWGNPSNFDREEVVCNLRQAIQTIKRAGYPVMLYTNKSGYNLFIEDEFADEPLWICSLSAPPAHDQWLLWQHSHIGKVEGVDTHVDINTYHGDMASFERWLSPFVVNVSDTI